MARTTRNFQRTEDLRLEQMEPESTTSNEMVDHGVVVALPSRKMLTLTMEPKKIIVLLPSKRKSCIPEAPIGLIPDVVTCVA
eukprot:259419-Hanusia_phi.AAC.1